MRRTRTLGLGVVMALALFAFPAGASASGGIEAEAYPAILQGSGGAGSQVLNFGDNTYDCASWFEDLLEGPSGAIAVAPNWNSCWPKPVKANGCKLEFNPGSESSAEISPACGPITTTLGLYCAVSFEAAGPGPASFQNVGEGTKAFVEIDAEIPLKYTISGSNCGSKGSGTATYRGEWKVQGTNFGGNSVGIHAVDELATGFFLEGEESKEESEQPSFEAESYPAIVNGALASETKLELQFGNKDNTVVCPDTQFDAETSSAGSELTTEVKYSGCALKVLPGTKVSVSMSSCQHVFTVANAGPPYTGSLDLVCAKEGDAISLTWSFGVFGKCTVTVAPQSLADVSYENLGGSFARTVAAEISGSNIEYGLSNTGIGCAGLTKGAANGTVAAEVGLRAYR